MSRMLVIDDDPSIVQMLRAYFTAKGHNVTVARGGKEGIAKYNSGVFDIVLTDLMMPDVIGFQVIDAVKTSKNGARTAVILVTADKDDPDVSSYKRLEEQDATVVKPFDIPALERKVNSLLKAYARDNTGR